MDAKSEKSPGGTLPRQQRQAKRSVSAKLDLPTPLQLFNTDYTAEARKQMSMYYNSTSVDPNRKQTGQLNDTDFCQKIEKCFIDGPSVHYGRLNLQAPYNQQQVIYGGNFGQNFNGQFQTQAEVHVEQHSQIEVCMVTR
jgi:hypothetical protein